MKKETKMLFYMGIGVVAATLIVGCHRSRSEHEQEQTPDIDVAGVVVDSVTLTKTYPATLKAANTIDIVARVDGTLISKNYNDGDMVSAGQVLFTIEPTQYADAVRQAEASLSTARNALEYQTSHYAAVRQALQSNAVSEQEVLQAESNFHQAEAQVRSAEAQLRTARTNLGYCTVRAPRSGRITASTVSVGSMVSGAGQPFTLATLYDDSSLNVVFQVEDAAHLRMMTARRDSLGLDFSRLPVTFEQNLGRQYYADLSYVAPDIDVSTGTIELKAKINNPSGDLRDGMYCTISLPYGFDSHAILVRDASISSDQLGKYVYTVNDSNKVVYTPITVSELVGDTMRIVTSGLTPRSRYVTRALLKVRDGMTINPVDVSHPSR